MSEDSSEGGLEGTPVPAGIARMLLGAMVEASHDHDKCRMSHEARELMIDRLFDTIDRDQALALYYLFNSMKGKRAAYWIGRLTMLLKMKFNVSDPASGMTDEEKLAAQMKGDDPQD